MIVRGRTRETAIVLLTSAVLAGVLLAGSHAQAKNMHGKFGTGYQRTLLGAQGLSFTYWGSPQLALCFQLGAGFVLDASNSTTTNLVAAGGVKYVFYGTKFANLSIGGKIDLGWATKLTVAVAPDTTGTDGAQPPGTREASNVTQWGLEVPLEVEYFLSDAFSFNLATGATFTVYPEGVARDSAFLGTEGLGSPGEAEFKGIGIGGGALFGHAGFTIYF